VSQTSRPRRYKPVGKCIYCGSAGPLSMEHVVPFGLAGDLELPAASCSDCAIITGRFEGVVQRSMLGNARIKMNLPSRRKTKRPKLIELELYENDKIVKRHLPLSEHPTSLPLMGFGIPRILLGHEGPDLNDNMYVNIVHINLGEDHMSNLKKIVPDGGIVHNKIYVVAFGRMLAKIAHSYAAAEIGVDNFIPLATDFILEKTEIDGNYLVGGDLIDWPPLNPEWLHELKWRWIDTVCGRFLYIGVRLFGCFGGPQNYVVVGRPIS
jgi:hypothetical protein